jgi:hypothetical protein
LRQLFPTADWHADRHRSCAAPGANIAPHMFRMVSSLTLSD